jgi:hypothetical protein
MEAWDDGRPIIRAKWGECCPSWQVIKRDRKPSKVKDYWWVTDVSKVFWNMRWATHKAGIILGDCDPDVAGLRHGLAAVTHRLREMKVVGPPIIKGKKK